MAEHQSFESALAAAQAGHPSGLAALWRAHHRALLAYLRACEGSAAEDIASETWLSVARSLPSFEGDEPAFRGWLFTIARRRLADHRRTMGRRPELATSGAGLDRPSADDPAASVVADESTAGAVATIAALPGDQADALLLRVVADLDVATVARLLGKTPGAVRVLCHRGLRRLAEQLAATDAAPVPAP